MREMVRLVEEDSETRIQEVEVHRRRDRVGDIRMMRRRGEGRRNRSLGVIRIWVVKVVDRRGGR